MTPVNVTLVVTEPFDMRSWGATLDRLERLARAERPGEAGDVVASIGGTSVAFTAIAAGLLALIGAGVISLPPELVETYRRLAGEEALAQKVRP